MTKPALGQLTKPVEQKRHWTQCGLEREAHAAHRMHLLDEGGLESALLQLLDLTLGLHLPRVLLFLTAVPEATRTM